LCGRAAIVTCEKCGTEVAEGQSVCPKCEFPVSVEQIGPVYVPHSAQPPDVIPAVPELAVTAKRQIYAGFWLRAAAFLIDSLILGFLTALIAGFYPSAFFRSLDVNSLDLNLLVQSPLSVLTPLGIAWFTAFPSLYGAAFESSGWQATPGKRILGIYVTGLRGQRVTFLRAFLRNLAKQISSFLLLGYFLAGFTPRKQALHDILASCLIVRRVTT
jgi:uncharacterized RDD family membrane protein YckC